VGYPHQHLLHGLEAATADGGAWDNESGVPRVGQLDLGSHTISFDAVDRDGAFRFSEVPGNS
jgi:hypothetical protein